MKRLIFLVFALLWMFSACTSGKTDELSPPEVLYGHDICAACGMMIDDPRVAAATLLTDGDYVKFDDLGEMFSYHIKQTEAQVRAWFVHDYDSESWLRGEEAYYVQSETVHTPMGMGIVAFTEKSRADSFAVEHDGSVFTFDEIRLEMNNMEHK